MFATEITAPGEKVDIDYESLAHYLNSTVPSTSPSTHKKRRVSTAHIIPFESPNGMESFAFDELASECAQFLGSPTIDESVLHFASSIVTIIGSPTVTDSEEVKRRIEQVLPTQHGYKHRRGMKISEEDCIKLCSLADRAIHLPVGKPTNVEIVDDDIGDGNDNVTDKNYGMNDVQYIRHTDYNRKKQQIYKTNTKLETGTTEYDFDVTPYGSDVEGQTMA
ncbi:hypothetical protein EDC96DRAFT_512043 [Choanephora cucurbitarum]|nr:hypothetical protein EDC96DRAFT_512043 [Choanephora cucurbitarum]